MVVTTISIGVTGCGDDDKEPGNTNTNETVDNKDSYKLIGKWESESKNYGYKLDADGRGYGFEAPYNSVSRWSISWTYKNNRLEFTDEDGDKEVLMVSYISDDMLLFHFDDENTTNTLYKVQKFSWE